MKVICISQCQTDRKIVYEIGKEYDIPEELYRKNKAFFEKAEKKNKSEGG